VVLHYLVLGGKPPLRPVSRHFGLFEPVLTWANFVAAARRPVWPRARPFPAACCVCSAWPSGGVGVGVGGCSQPCATAPLWCCWAAAVSLHSCTWRCWAPWALAAGQVRACIGLRRPGHVTSAWLRANSLVCCSRAKKIRMRAG
jgi:hypothetical protein